MSFDGGNYVADKTITDNKKAIVTETYKAVGGYLPNSYQETLTLNPGDPEVNKIIFLYVKDEVNGMYAIHYYFEDVSGGTYTENTDWSYLYHFQSVSNATGSTATVVPLDGAPGATVTLHIGANHIVFKNIYVGSDWLGSEDSKDNRFDSDTP